MAEKTQGAILRVESARATTKAITGLTAANPGVVTATANAYANGDIIYLANVGGMTQVNDRAFAAASVATNTFNLKGVDTTNYTPYTSGGDSYKVTLISVAEVTNITIGGGGSQQIDVTNLQSLAIEQLPGLPNLGSISLEVTLNHTDAGQIALRALAEATTPKVITITTATGYVLCATGYTSNYGATIALNNAQRGTFDFTVYRKPTWFA